MLAPAPRRKYSGLAAIGFAIGRWWAYRPPPPPPPPRGPDRWLKRIAAGYFIRLGAYVLFWPLVIALPLLLASVAHPTPIDPADIRVIDGDTIRVFHKQPNVRLGRLQRTRDQTRGLRSRGRA